MKKILTLILLASIGAVAQAQIVSNDEKVEEPKTKQIEMPANGRRVDRGIQKLVFVPKGQWFVSATASYTSYTADDFKLLILDNIKANANTFGFKVQAGYCFANNLGAGLGFDFNRNRVDLPNMNISLGDDASLDIQDYYSIQQVYTGTAFLRSYVNLGNSNRFALFSDVKLSLGGGQGKVLNGKGEELKGTYQKIFNAGILLQPGVSVFLTDFFAVEASVGLLGLQYSRTEQITNQVYQGYYEKWKANFKVNLFAINLGMSFYF